MHCIHSIKSPPVFLRTGQVAFDGFDGLNYSVKSHDIKGLPGGNPLEANVSSDHTQIRQKEAPEVASAVTTEIAQPEQIAEDVVEVLDDTEQGKFCCNINR